MDISGHRVGYQWDDSHETAKIADILLETLHSIEACKRVCKQAVICVGHHVPCSGMTKFCHACFPLPSVIYRQSTHGKLMSASKVGF